MRTISATNSPGASVNHSSRRSRSLPHESSPVVGSTYGVRLRQLNQTIIKCASIQKVFIFWRKPENEELRDELHTPTTLAALDDPALLLVPLYVLDIGGPGFLRFGLRAEGGVIVHTVEAIEFTERSSEGG